jgi:rod shape-determining protein MreD
VTFVVGIPFLAVLAALQSGLVGHLRLLDGRPDLVLLAIVSWSLTGRGREGILLGFIGGLFLDSFSEIPLGVSSASLVLIAAMVSYSEGQFWGANPLMQVAAVLSSSALFYAIGLLAIVLAGRQPDLLTALSRIVLPGIFLNLVLALPAIQLGDSLHSTLFPERVAV